MAATTCRDLCTADCHKAYSLRRGRPARQCATPSRHRRRSHLVPGGPYGCPASLATGQSADTSALCLISPPSVIELADDVAARPLRSGLLFVDWVCAFVVGILIVQERIARI